MSQPHWWTEMSTQVEATGADQFSAAWYAGMRDAYLVRFPEADERSKTNMREMAAQAAADERRVAMFAGKWRADGHTEPPTDEALSAAFARCVKPPSSRLYPAIRAEVGRPDG